LGLDAVAMEPEVVEGLTYGGRQFAELLPAGRQTVGDGGPLWRAGPSDRGLQTGRAGLAGRRGDVLGPRILVHVEHDVEPVTAGPVDRLLDAGDVGLVEHSAAGLEQRTVHDQPDAV